VLESAANVYCPACKLWNTGHGADMMRQAVSLMGGYGITEDCPGFLFHKWMDAQLEATYEGPEAVQRRQLSVTMLSPLFLEQFRIWTREMRAISNMRPLTGACALATAMELWTWSVQHLQEAKDADGNKLYNSARHGVTFPLADALSWLLASRSLVLDALELEARGPENPNLAEGIEGLVNFYRDMCHTHIGETVGVVGKICTELVVGYNRHPEWKREDCTTCYCQQEVDNLESIIPGLAASVVGADVIGDDDSHPVKAGPCASFRGMERFARIRQRMDGCLTGCRVAKDRAAQALTEVMIPEALDYPQ
jgi:hypothetical protein